MAATVYLNAIRQAKRQFRTARAQRLIAYHLDDGYHGEAEEAAPGWYCWFPHPTHRGILVEAAALSLGSNAHPEGPVLPMVTLDFSFCIR